MDHKLTTRSQEAVANALRLAQDAGNPSFEPIHLLAALLQDHEGIAFQVLNEVADTATIENTTRAALAQLPSSTGESVAEPNPTQATLKVVRLAGDEASDNGDDYVSTEHLLVGLALNEGQVGKILNGAGASANPGFGPDLFQRRGLSQKTAQSHRESPRRSEGDFAEPRGHFQSPGAVR